MNSSTEVKASICVKVALSSASLMVPFRARIVRTAPSYWFLFGDGRLVAWGRPQELGGGNRTLPGRDRLPAESIAIPPADRRSLLTLSVTLTLDRASDSGPSVPKSVTRAPEA
jgi:hypothetical protein